MITLIVGLASAQDIQIVIGIVLSVLEIILVFLRILLPFLPDGKFKDVIAKIVLISPMIIKAYREMQDKSRKGDQDESSTE